MKDEGRIANSCGRPKPPEVRQIKRVANRGGPTSLVAVEVAHVDGVPTRRRAWIPVYEADVDARIEGVRQRKRGLEAQACHRRVDRPIAQEVEGSGFGVRVIPALQVEQILSPIEAAFEEVLMPVLRASNQFVEIGETVRVVPETGTDRPDERRLRNPRNKARSRQGPICWAVPAWIREFLCRLGN